MDTNRLRASLLAVTAAVAVAVSGTFAWQSISQTAMNETALLTNPGGRLHDDFNGYGDGTTKDIYVENFGTEPIYARVRLDEYMEIGAGASKKSLDGTTPNPENKAVSVVTGAKIDDPTTWTTHIPGDPAAVGEGAEIGFSNPARTFHTYWTWTMGGQTVYMPTFNKNKDSLQADINGTFNGLDPTDDIYYDDYIAYKVNDTKTAAEFLDGDGDIPSGSEVEHTAKETLTAQVITMAEYNALNDTEKTALNAWVYDADGWAYWSQAIQPDTATGLLLDKIELTTGPSSAWYYAINAVAQFITADDLGRLDNTGFYDATGGKEPSADALALLKFLGVDTGTVTINGTTVEVGNLTQTVTVDGIEWLVLAKGKVSGKAVGDSESTSHNAALLLSKNVLETRQFDASSPRWMNSALRTYLNGTFLNTYSEVAAKAVQVNIKTRQTYNGTTFDTTSDTVFLLSSADVCGQYNNGSGWQTSSAEEYTYNGARLSCFAAGGSTADPGRIGYLNGSAQWWWLRSPAGIADDVAYVNDGGKVIGSYIHTANSGVRPAFWYNLD